MSHYHYKLVVSYKGTNYYGWQIQKTLKNTIQGTLNRALQSICKSNDIKSLGSGRTDAGVHAIAQVVKVSIPIRLPEIALKKALNSFLPDSIRVKHSEFCEEAFHPVFHAKNKEYIYLFSNETDVGPFSPELITNFKYELDIEIMKKACRLFIGKHDFSNFFCTGTDVKSTIREIFECELIEYDSTKLDSIWNQGMKSYLFRVRGSGFLKQMVRLMVGSLFSIGSNKIDLYDLKDALEDKERGKVGAVAPPQGLYLKEVTY